MTPHEELIELKGIVPEHVWPKRIKIIPSEEYREMMGYSWGYIEEVTMGLFDIEDQHALAIVRDAVEKWLIGLGWNRGAKQGTVYGNQTHEIYRLPAAVRYVVEVGG